MHPMLNIAIRAARSAENVIIRQIDSAQDLPVEQKARNDFVSLVDKQAEKNIIYTILQSYPDHAILAEESGAQGENEYQWIIDPLDGTTNFLHGFPQFAISIALFRGKLPYQAVIYDPLRQELFTASRGRGAYLNERRIRVSKRKSLEGALLGTGYPFNNTQIFDHYLQTLRALMPMVAGIRRAGAASLDLAYVACGRLDGFWEFGLKQWDIAAGLLIIQEAGGGVSDTSGDKNYMESGNIVAGNYDILKEMLALLNPNK